ncbi:MAG: PLP-dependent aminotransferase family protein [Clostridiales bacterium]|nr:PLP-dependent aminotransferase family protein [Clostridiales bacterium]
MKIEIDRELKTPVYLQIAGQIRRQIESGEISAGQRLPSERKLAEHLGVNRTTVLNAYGELKAEGLLGAHVGNGTIVQSSAGEEDRAVPTQTEPVWNQVFSQYTGRFESGLVKDLLALASRPDFISFATGIASPDSGPAEILNGLESALLKKENTRALLHSPTEGFLSLRQAMCGLMRKRGVFCDPEEVMMLAGSQQGIDLASRIFLDPGDIVVLEEPTYFPAIQVFKTIGARVMTVPMDEDGMRVDLLEQLLHRHRPKLIYTIPTHHNPTGIDMTIGRRKRLVELAKRYNVIILEDDAYGGIDFEEGGLPLLKELDDSGFVIYLSSFSKNVYSGLRMGWIAADKRIIREFSACKQLTDLHSGSLSQWLVERFILSGGLDAHMKKICVEYRVRRDLALSALGRFAPKGAVWNNPKGGYYIWCRLPEGLSADSLIKKAAEYKVSFIPGTPFFSSGCGDDYIRLNFTYAPINSIEEGIRLLCKAMKELTELRTPDAYEHVTEVTPIV